MRVHLLDGTYELFRHFFGQPPRAADDGTEIGATYGVVTTVLLMLEGGVTHLGVATDHVIRSFRNDLWADYKTGDEVPDTLRSQFEPLEDALRALGVVVWPMVEVEADDALASAASVAADDRSVEQVLICTPDKDLGQCVHDPGVIQLDRRNAKYIDEAAIQAKFGVLPPSIPDWLALVGDSADGFPGLPGWGAKSAGAVLGRYPHLEDIPDQASAWDVDVRGAARLAATLVDQRPLAELFRVLATLRTDAEVGAVDEWQWVGPTDQFDAWATRLGAPGLARRAERLAERRA